MQIAFSFRRQTAQLFGAHRAIAKSRNERPGADNHLRKGAVTIPLDLLACAWLSTNTRHLQFLAS
jgi:hypothetical protein